jgi:hypothetical protein
MKTEFLYCAPTDKSKWNDLDDVPQQPAESKCFCLFVFICYSKNSGKREDN